MTTFFLHKAGAMKIVCVLLTLFYVTKAFADESQPQQTCMYPGVHAEVSDKDAQWQARLRARALIKLDKVLSWALPMKERVFHLHPEEEGVRFVSQSEHMVEFARSYSYFSKKRPVISSVSSQKEDVALACHLLTHLFSHCKNEEFLEMATAEILTKVIAFRDLLEGMHIPIPSVIKSDKPRLVNYTVDKVFALWPCMPAFGLVPDDPKAGAILLFRGTDLSLESKRGWASVLSDLDIQGPGLTAFLKSKEDIEKWLKEKTLLTAKPKVMGFSLGGVLALYTYIYEHELLDTGSCYAFNPPGISLSVHKEWKDISVKHKEGIQVYVTQGDIIPKIGLLAGEAYELSIDGQLRPVDAHVRLMCCQPSIFRFKIDLREENIRRR